MIQPPVEHDGTIGATIVQVAEDTRAFATAQVDLYKAIAGARMRAAKVGIVLGIVAGVLGLAALIALIVGLILTLATVVGPGFATAIVVGGVALIAAVLGKMAATRLSRAFGGDA